MNIEPVLQFYAALEEADDESALALLEKGRVTIDSAYFFEFYGVRLSYPIIFMTVKYVRERVVRAFVLRGASIDPFRDGGNGGFFTPACDAISRGDVPALSLCLRNGANLACVSRTADSPPHVRSGLEVAIAWNGDAKHAPLIYLLDEVYTARPVRLSRDEIIAVVVVAMLGTPAKVCYGILESRGLKIKDLEEMKCIPSDGFPDATSFADVLLAYAQKSGAANLLRYLVKDLGLVSTAGLMESLEVYVDGIHTQGVDAGFAGVALSRAEMTKYKCAACEFVGATEFCSRFKVPRYCSKECQRSHWKTGGHKQECKNIQRRMLSADGTKEGSSGAAGSSES